MAPRQAGMILSAKMVYAGVVTNIVNEWRHNLGFVEQMRQIITVTMRKVGITD